MGTLRLEGVSRFYQQDEAAVDDLTVSFGTGEFVCLLGPSGCGKTTTLRMIAGLEVPDSGRVLHDGTVLSSSVDGTFVPPEGRNMGLMFQSYALWPHMTVVENIAFGLKMRKEPLERQDRRVGELMTLLKIDGLERRYPSELSGGQQQRVALARMLAVDPSVLLLDEPLSNLDAALRLEMRAELKRLHASIGCTTILVTHDQLEAMTLASSIAVMRNGRIEQLGTPLEVYRSPASRFVGEFVGHPPMNIIEPDPAHGDLWSRIASHTGGTSRASTTFGIRPEALRIASSASATAPDAVRIEATLETILPTGAEWILGFRCDGQSLFGLMWDEPVVPVGESVALEIRSTDIHVFAAETTTVAP